MVVGICEIILHLPENHSLKGKRQVLRSIKDQVRRRFNVSVAETEDQDLWQRAVLGIACVGNAHQIVNQTLDYVLNFIENLHLAVISDYRIEIITP